jgi:hypothetical protein
MTAKAQRFPTTLRAMGVARRLAIAVAMAALVTGCMTGERPSFDTTPTSPGMMTGDPAVDAVLTAFDTVSTATFTAVYTTTQRFGGTTTAATVTQAGTLTRRSVTIGEVRFITDASTVRTCLLATATCENGARPEAVSNTGITPEFATGDFAKRLRRDALARVGDSIATVIDVAGQQATCVDVSLAGGVESYCAFANGALARYRGADVIIEVTSYQAEVDETLFAA